MDRIQKRQPLTIYGGKQLIDFISAPVVVKALKLASELPDAITGPVNVGSGKGVTLFELAQKLNQICRHHSEIVVKPAREAEVVRYTADINRFNKLFKIKLGDDPLAYLTQMIRP